MSNVQCPFVRLVNRLTYVLSICGQPEDIWTRIRTLQCKLIDFVDQLKAKRNPQFSEKNDIISYNHGIADNISISCNLWWNDGVLSGIIYSVMDVIYQVTNLRWGKGVNDSKSFHQMLIRCHQNRRCSEYDLINCLRRINQRISEIER